MSDLGLATVMNDLCERLVAWLTCKGFDVSPTERAEVSRALEACLRVRDRTIGRRPRNVHRSDRLRAKVLDAQLELRLETIEREFINGEDLNPRLTRQYFDASFDDRLLNDLGVTHLHLGDLATGTDKTKTRTMAGGTKELLWAVVRPDDAFFIDVLDHSAFSSFDFVQVISTNWKYLLGKPLPGAADLEPKLSPDGRARLRRAGIVTPVEVDGELFLPRGYMKSGLSMQVALSADRILNRVVEMHRWLTANADTVAKKLEEVTGTRPAPLDLRVGDIDEVLAGRPTLVARTTNFEFYKRGDEIRYRVSANPH